MLQLHLHQNIGFLFFLCLLHLPNLHEDIFQDRYDRFMSRAQQLSEFKLKEKIGKTFTCVIDSVEQDHLICRSIFDAPEIDGIVSVPIKQPHHRVGERVTVKIRGSSEYDLEGELLLS